MDKEQKPKTRESPRKTVEKHDPKVEHLYAKLPGGGLADITLCSNHEGTMPDFDKLFKVLAAKVTILDGLPKYPTYISLHNHPVERKASSGDEALPSSQDIISFVNDSLIRTMIIVQQDAETGEIEGCTVLKKTKAELEKEPHISWDSLSFYRKIPPGGLSGYEILKVMGRTSPDKLLKEVADKYGLRYRFIPAKGYELPSTYEWRIGWRYIKKQQQ